MRPFLLEDDGHCFACGKKNEAGLKLDFRDDNGKSVAEFFPAKIHQGYKDIVHGGIISAILDEAMMKAVLSQGIYAVTAELTVRFRTPLMVGERALVQAQINNLGRRLIEASAEIRNDAAVIATASAKMLRNA